MITNPKNSWYTDLMSVFRVDDIKVGNLTKKERRQVLENVPCRLYSTDLGKLKFQETSALADHSLKVACGVDVDIKSGDELFIKRGALVGGTRPAERVFAGDIQYYYEPFGGVVPQLQHQEIAVSNTERV